MNTIFLYSHAAACAFRGLKSLNLCGFPASKTEGAVSLPSHPQKRRRGHSGAFTAPFANPPVSDRSTPVTGVF